MSSNIRFMWDNAYIGAAVALTASSSVTGLPVTNTQSDDRSKVWQSSTSTGTPTIDIDLGAVTEVTACALANVRMLGAGSVELYQRGDGGAPGAATLVVTLSAQDTKTRAVAAFFASQSHRHWQLKWTNPSVVNDYAELGFAFLGTYTEPAINVKVPLSQGRLDPSVKSASVDGQQSWATRTKFHQGSFPFDAVTQAQLEQLQAMFDEMGVASPMFVTLDTAISWMTWMLRLGSLTWEVEPGGAIGRFGPVMPWEEVR